MYSIAVPRLNANDEDCLLCKWLFEDGEAVTAGAAVAVLETAKASVELTTAASGVVQRVAAVGRICAVGEVIGYVFENGEERRAYLADRGTASEPATEEMMGAGAIVTDEARQLIDRHRISAEQVDAIHQRVIRAADVRHLLESSQAGEHTLQARVNTAAQERRQAAIARTVVRSHATIPSAFLLMRVWCDTLLGRVRAWSARESVYAGLPEVLTRTVAIVSAEFPRFLRRQTRDPNVGLTIDVGRGLFLPVIRAAASRSLADIARDVMEFRSRASTDRFQLADLADGDISISLNGERDVVTAVPIIVPGQTCMLSLGAVYEELTLSDTQVTPRKCVNLGIAYDHRSINGGDATAFLKAVKERLEDWAG